MARRIDFSKLSDAAKKRHLRRTGLGALPCIPEATDGSSEVRRTVLLIDDCLAHSTEAVNAKCDPEGIKGALLRLAFRVAITEDDWSKLAATQAKRKKAGDDQNEPIKISLRIARS